MLSIIFGSAILLSSSSTCDLNLPERCDVWSPVSNQYYTDGQCPNTRPYCDTRDPLQLY